MGFLLGIAQAVPRVGFGTRVSHFPHPNGPTACKAKYFNATLDHFSWGVGPGGRTHYLQRYFVCDEHWKSGGDSAHPGPIFFYCGNEANVELYLNATGLMWETAAEFGALLLFAEHRYYGKSLPFSEPRKHMQYLSSEQALADYAELLFFVKRDLGAENSPTIAFGGSYGGMLATWLRLKYPAAVVGAVAGSAPVWSFLGEDPPYDLGSYAKKVTYDTTPQAGAAAGCTDNMRAAWKELLRRTTAPELEAVESLFKLCPEQRLRHQDDLYALALWAQSAFDFMAMGNFPYPSSYILNGDGTLPAYPMRVACESLAGSLEGDALIEGLRDAVGVFYNYTHERPCFDFTQGVNPDTQQDGEFWGFQFCTEMFQPMSRDGVLDSFFPQPWNMTASFEDCQQQWSVTPRPYWATISYGGRDIASASNIVWSNGEFDPWSGGGVTQSISESLVAILIEGGAHHLDFMWSNPLDPPSVLQARALEKQHMWRWVTQARKATNNKSSEHISAFDVRTTHQTVA